MILVSCFLSAEDLDLEGADHNRCTPPVEYIRPSSCPKCGALAHLPDGSSGLVGHGTYVRKVRGVGSPARTVSIRVRRYRCKSCGTTISVLPDVLHPRRRYPAYAIVEALRRHLIKRRPAREIRQQLTDSTNPATSWRTLYRWRRALLSGLWGWLGARFGANGPAQSRREGRRRVALLVAEQSLSMFDFTLANTVHVGNHCWRAGHAPPEGLERKSLTVSEHLHPHRTSAHRHLASTRATSPIVEELLVSARTEAGPSP